jgi:hypothetical protein
MCSKSELSSHHLSHTNLERRVQPYLPSKRPQSRLAASSIETGKDPTVLHQVLHATFRQLFGVSLFTALWETLCLPGKKIFLGNSSSHSREYTRSSMQVQK